LLAAALAFALIGRPAFADEAEGGRELYTKFCANCHGQITEVESSLDWRALTRKAVMNPTGPNLTGIVGRPAGIVEGYPYSEAFRKAAPEIVWDEQTLDLWITNSQAMIRGSMMFLKLPEPEKRARIIAYLKKHSRD
jgi:cytochrome c